MMTQVDQSQPANMDRFLTMRQCQYMPVRRMSVGMVEPDGVCCPRQPRPRAVPALPPGASQHATGFMKQRRSGDDVDDGHERHDRQGSRHYQMTMKRDAQVSTDRGLNASMKDSHGANTMPWV